MWNLQVYCEFYDFVLAEFEFESILGLFYDTCSQSQHNLDGDFQVLTYHKSLIQHKSLILA